MKLRPDGLWRVAGVGGAGAVWGLGLARLVAEADFCTPLYGSLPAVAGVAIGCAAILIALYWSLVIPHWSFLIPLLLPLPYITGLVSGPLAGGVLLVGGAVLALLLADVSQSHFLCYNATGSVPA